MAFGLDPSAPSAAPASPPSAPAEVVTLDDGSNVLVRPIDVTDAYRLRRMFDRLSPTSVYHRFFSPIRAPRADTLRHLAGVDHYSRDAIIGEVDGEIIGVARYEGKPGSDEAEVAVTVEDAWQRRGLGSLLLERLVRLAQRRGLVALRATILGENQGAVRFLRQLSPDVEVRFQDGGYEVYAPLRPRSRAHVGSPTR